MRTVRRNSWLNGAIHHHHLLSHYSPTIATMPTTATDNRDAATQSQQQQPQQQQPPQPQQQRSPGFLASLQHFLSPQSTNPSNNTTSAGTPRASNKSNNEDNSLLTPRPLPGIDYEVEEDGQQGVVGNDVAKKGNEEDDDVSSIAMSVGRVSTEQRESSVVATTARKTSKKKSTAQSKKKKTVTIGKNKRVKVVKSKLLTIIPVDSPAYEVLTSYPRSDTNFYGTVMSNASARKLYTIKFDAFPEGHQTFELVRKTLAVLDKGEDEPPFDREQARAADEAEECATTTKKKDSTFAKESVDAFLNLSVDEHKTAKTFNYKFGPNENDSIAWTILQDDEDITTDTMSDEVKKLPPFKKDIPWESNQSAMDYSKIFFEEFFPDMDGKAKRLDEYLRHPNSGWNTTVTNGNIKFHRPDKEDPDELVSVI